MNKICVRISLSFIQITVAKLDGEIMDVRHSWRLCLLQPWYSGYICFTQIEDVFLNPPHQQIFLLSTNFRTSDHCTRKFRNL